MLPTHICILCSCHMPCRCGCHRIQVTFSCFLRTVFGVTTLQDYSICLLQEMNEQDERTHFLQIWMTPDKRGHKPQYGSSTYSKADRNNKLLHILGGTGTMPAWKTATPGAGISLHQVSLSRSASTGLTGASGISSRTCQQTMEILHLSSFHLWCPKAYGTSTTLLHDWLWYALSANSGF